MKSILHARELLETAAEVATHGPALVNTTQRISASSLESYWVASKSRLDEWSAALKKLSQVEAPTKNRSAAKDGAPSEGVISHDQEAAARLLEEILCSEMLTRCWAAVLVAYDRSRGEEYAEPIARSCLLGHIESRHRALNLLVRGKAIEHDRAIALNRLRRKVERWTDLLIANICQAGDVSDLASDPARCREFAMDMRHQRSAVGCDAWALTTASLRSAFAELLTDDSPHAELNGRIAESVMSCFPPELFAGTGTLRSLWLARITHHSADVELMLNELFAAEAMLPPVAVTPERRVG